MQTTLTLNGERRALDIEPATLLVDLLRDRLHLTGTHIGCDTSQCGACNVLVDGVAMKSCTLLAVQMDGRAVTPIEGVADGETLHPMQAAFVKHDGYQCAYCTPGQICSAVAVLEQIKAGVPSHVTADLNGKPAVTGDELRERMSGNICRCGAYSNIVEAIEDVAGVKA